MKRREAIARMMLIAATGTPLAVAAQAGKLRKPARIGFLPDLWEFQQVLFREAMLERGWREGRDYIILFSGIAAPAIEDAVLKILFQKPDLLYVANTGYALAAHRRTQTIPIVMLVTGYPVEAGLARSLARPGKNVTGNSGYAGVGFFGKLLELLRDTKPDIRRIGVLWSYVTPVHPREEVEPIYAEMREAARKLRVALQIEEITRPEELPASLDRLRASRSDALFITSGPGLWSEAKRMMEFVIQNRIVSIADWPWSEDLHPLLTYSPTF
ncbi:MAG: ABC transporter substrate-binding protein, partial [Pseudomonadota bacterium]